MTDPQEKSGGDASGATGINSNFWDMSKVVVIHRNLVLLEEKARVSEKIAKTHTRKIERLEQWTANLRHLEQDVEKNALGLNELKTGHTSLEMSLEKRLNSLGERVGTQVNGLAARLDNKIHELETFDVSARRIGWIAIALTGAAMAFLVYFLHFLESHVVFKP
jgi:hypothetical protein